MSMTFKKAIDDVTNNDVVLSVTCKIAEAMQVPYSRVTDAYGGYCKNPSKTLPAKKAAAATTTTTTTAAAKTNTTAAAKTRVLAANATANKTATPAKTSWTVDLFVQPDPFADKVDNAATTKTLKDKAVAGAISGVTSAKFGAATVAATVSAEAAVKFVTAPAATGGSAQITIAGSVDVASYVYCAIAKNPSRLRMLNATNATNATTTATTTTAATTTVAKKTEEAITSLQGAAATATHKVER